MVTTLAAYIARNKARPRPEWQRTVEPKKDPSNPFQIIHGPLAGPANPKPHPLINKRFPLVMMLEPLHACNLTCTGCGRIREYESTITQMLSLEQCLKAVDECGAPVVSVCGGEPLLYPKMGELSKQIIARDKHVILCTNGMFIAKKLSQFEPHANFQWNVHLDGMEKNHDLAVEREGVFREAVEGIKAAKAAGFRVMTNTTVYKETDMKEIEELFEFCRTLGVDGHAIAPAYGYSAVNDREIFLTREDIYEKFAGFDRLVKKYPVTTSPVYIEFLQGKRELPCTAWGNPTYNTKGWKGPCYLITDAHYDTFEELMTHTQWNNYGPGNDPRCEHCMMHCGFEPSAAMGINGKFSDNFKTLSWLLS
jgi:hopanoid biosynthesis associated radical SAM protein HpnH